MSPNERNPVVEAIEQANELHDVEWQCSFYTPVQDTIVLTAWRTVTRQSGESSPVGYLLFRSPRYVRLCTQRLTSVVFKLLSQEDVDERQISLKQMDASKASPLYTIGLSCAGREYRIICGDVLFHLPLHSGHG